MKIKSLALHACWLQSQSDSVSPAQAAFKESPFVDIPSGVVLCGGLGSPLIRRHVLLYHKEPGLPPSAMPNRDMDTLDADAWAICDALMENEGYESLAHYMPADISAAVKERIALEHAGDPQARIDWQARHDLARELATSATQISAHMMAVSALSIGYEPGYFEHEAVWMRRPYKEGDQREWETLRRDGAFCWELPAGVMDRVMLRVQEEMRERGMLPGPEGELSPRLEWLERAR